MTSILQRIFRLHGASFMTENRVPAHWSRAVGKLSRCRTAALGGHVQGCPAGHIERIWYNSCRHRSCPQCNQLQIAQWLQKQRARLLDCAHHHIIFTIPHDFNCLWIQNAGTMMEILFQCARETLQQLLRDERRLGDGEPGFMLALHTWGRSLSLHPHLHCLITDGGWNGVKWQTPKGSCFLPARVLMAKFRGKFLALVRTALQEGKLRLPAQLCDRQMQYNLNRLGRSKWNVHLRERYGHGNGVVQYLARYVRGGPLHDGQLAIPDGNNVAFRYTPHTDSGAARHSSVMTLAAPAFLRRYLQHVPLSGKHTVRSYGLYAPRKVAYLDQARAVFRQPPAAATPALTWQAYYAARQPQAAIHVCAVCGAPMSNVRRIAPQRGPPVPRTVWECPHA